MRSEIEPLEHIMRAPVAVQARYWGVLLLKSRSLHLFDFEAFELL
jgi:hypothetical protein